MNYSKEFKEEALKLSDEIGLKKAAHAEIHRHAADSAILLRGIDFLLV